MPMKEITTISMCLLMGTMTAILAAFVPGLFYDFMKIAESGVKFGIMGWTVFISIGVLSTILFFTGHAFKVLNKKVGVIIAKYFSFLD